MTLFTVFCLSSSSLFYEILLTRVFSTAHWNHLSFLVIGIAMLGYAVSGTVFALIRANRLKGAPGTFPAVSLLSGFSTLGSFVLFRLLPLDYLLLPVQRVQLFYLLLAILILSLPFFFSGLASCLAYLSMPEASGRVAAASMAGSGLGAALPALTLSILGEGGSLAASALLPLVPPLFFALRGVLHPDLRSIARFAAAALVTAAMVLFSLNERDGLLSYVPSPYKALPQLLMTPSSRVTERSVSLWGTFTSAVSPSLRFAPGLSLGYLSVPPPQSGIYRDGDDPTIISDLNTGGDAAFARSTHSYAGYVLAGRPRDVLVIQRGGGLGVACARASGASHILLAVDAPELARVLAGSYALTHIEVRADNPRSLLAREQGPFDVIHIEDWGPSLPGMASLDEDALFTTDALRDCWERLGGAGVLVVSRRIVLPPSDGLRLFASSLYALKAEGVREPSDHLAVIRNWDTYTLLVSRRPLAGATLHPLLDFAGAMGFDMDWFPGIGEGDTNRFNRLPGAPFFEAFSALAGGSDFAKDYFLDVAPQGDGRPFPNRFIKWTRLPEFFRSTGGRTYTLFLSGEMVVAACLGEALIVSAPLLVLPFLLRRGRGQKEGGRPRFRILLLFGGCGFGFLFAEIAFLDSYTVLFSNPSVTLSMVLGGMLAASGLGAAMAGRPGRKALLPIVAAAALTLLLLALLLPVALKSALPLGLPWRIAVCTAMLAVPSFILGMPFPLAMRFEPEGERSRSLAWAANGCASVVASPAAAMIAMGLGTSVLFIASAAAYVFMGMGLVRRESRASI
jgi:hypothetical protein